MLGIARSSLYYRGQESEENLRLMKRLDEQYTQTPVYGIRRMTAYLRQQGESVNHKRVARLMRKMGLEGIAPKPSLSKGNKQHKIYPYLLKEVDITYCNHVWSTDITYIRLAQGLVYLVAILDWYSRYVLAWELSITLEVDFCLVALQTALAQNQPFIFHSDQGSPFTSEVFTRQLLDRKILVSMDGKGRSP